MLLDPFEKQLHLPASLVELADHQCGQVKIIGQKDERSVLLLIPKTDSSQRNRIMFFGPRAFQPDGLVASQTLRLVDDSGFNDVTVYVTLVAHDKADIANWAARSGKQRCRASSLDRSVDQSRGPRNDRKPKNAANCGASEIVQHIDQKLGCEDRRQFGKIRV